MPQAKYWCFTVNTPTDDDEHLVRAMPYKYLIYSFEMGGNTETVHIQGYVAFEVAKRLTTLKKLLPRAHFEQRKGNHIQAKNYCMKVGDPTHLDGPYEFGDDTDISETTGGATTHKVTFAHVQRDLDEGLSLLDISQKYFSMYLRYYRAFAEYKNMRMKHREYTDGEKPKIIIYWGPTGTGKSSKVKRDFPGAYWLTKPTVRTTELWWQGYNSQDVVVFDEFYSWIPYDLLLRICDWNEMEVPVKGGSLKLAAKTFVFTSNQDPERWYSKVEDKSAWRRRLREFGTVVEMTDPVEEENFSIEPSTRAL